MAADNQDQYHNEEQTHSKGKDQKSNNSQVQESEDKELKKDENDPIEKNKRKRVLLIFGIVLVIALIGGVLYWLHADHFENTDDAQIDGNLSPIGSRISGTITRVYADNNQTVKVGNLLVELDPRDQQASVDQAKAQVAQSASAIKAQQPNVPITSVQADTNIESSKADVSQNEAGVTAAIKQRDQAAAQVASQEAATTKAQNDLKRYRELIEKQEVSKQDFDQYVATAKQQESTLEAQKQSLQAAEQNVSQNMAKLKQSQAQLLQNEKTAKPQVAIKIATVDQQKANLQSARAQLEQAVLNLSYTKIYSPVAGVVMKRAAQVGAGVSAGQQLMTVAQNDDLWVTANFKETQLRRIRPGQKVTVYVDSLDKQFNGTIFTVGAATGSIASTLPPENATGNFVKVIQRVPVRIQLDRDQDGHERLRPGMSVEPKVRIY